MPEEGEGFNESNYRSSNLDQFTNQPAGQPIDQTPAGTRIIGIVSGKGGVGKTSFSANLAIALTMLGKKVVVVDCNVTTPHLSYYLGVQNFSTTLNNVFAGDVDAQFAPLDHNGVMFIPASERFEDLKNVDMKDLDKITKKLAASGKFEFIILDSAPGLGREAIGVLNAANEIIFVTTPTAPNIMDVARCDEVARVLGHKKFGMVLNMVRGKDHEITPSRAEELFHMPVLGVVPFDENIMDSTAEGVPILWYKSKAPSCKYLLSIASRVAGVTGVTGITGIGTEEALSGQAEQDFEELEEAAEMEKAEEMDERGEGYEEYKEYRKYGIEPIVKRKAEQPSRAKALRKALGRAGESIKARIRGINRIKEIKGVFRREKSKHKKKKK